MKLRQRLALWLDPTPERIQHEQIELIVKAGRRCAHDLMHAASYIAAEEEQGLFHDQAHYWLTVFYPGGDGKDYRTRLHHEIERLHGLCLKNGIDPRDPDIPF